jgi:hypothetical protein
MAAMKACTGSSPSALAIWGFPPLRSTGFAFAARAVRFAVLFAGFFAAFPAAGFPAFFVAFFTA